ncbi:hypothetical protein B0H11DRAFT_2188717 [Mycena galericulata]|nr:hypothetical protein B0H11DRAFT_2188717 [Mycena galericulata]
MASASSSPGARRGLHSPSDLVDPTSERGIHKALAKNIGRRSSRDIGSKREKSSAHPGKIVNDAKQKRRSTQEKAHDELVKEQEKAAKAKATAEAHEAGVQRVADKEDALRLEDQHTRKHSARPDLLTAEVHRKLTSTANPRDEEATEKTATEDVDMGASDDEVRGSASEGDDDSDTYQPGNEPSEDEPSEPDADDDSDAEALQEFLKSRAAAKKKKTAKAGKRPKAAIRDEIQAAGSVAMPVQEKTLKRKPSAQSGDVQYESYFHAHVPSLTRILRAKKSKAAVGGLKKGWQKVIAAPQKISKTAIRGRASSVSSGMTLPSSRATSASSGKMSISEDAPGEFDNEESQESLQAARGSKSANEMVGATAKMGISLVPKDVALDVNGKVKRKAKPKYANADLPFPKESFAADLKFWQSVFLPEFIDWVATLEDAFAANAHPEFDTTVRNLWNQHFGAYTITDAVYGMAAAAVRNWRSKIGKVELKAMSTMLQDFPTIENRAQHVQEKLSNLRFVYEDEDAETGAYRSELILQGFAAHLEYVLKIDMSFGYPIGVLALVCSAAERALSMHKTGKCTTEGVKRKGKRSAQSFVAVPWAARAKGYLPGIKSLSPRKFGKDRGHEPQIGIDDTEDESEDSRGLINISDDSDAEEPAASPQV